MKNLDDFSCFLTDHSPIMRSLFSKSKGARDKGLWKLLLLGNLKKKNITYEQNVWEYLNKEI